MKNYFTDIADIASKLINKKQDKNILGNVVTHSFFIHDSNNKPYLCTVKLKEINKYSKLYDEYNNQLNNAQRV